MKAPEKPMRVCEFLDLRGVVEQPDREAYGRLLRAELKRRKARCTREVRGGRKVRLFEPLALMKANVHVRRVFGRVSGRALPGGMERPCPDDELPEVQFPGIRMPKGKCVPDGVRERFQARRRARKEAALPPRPKCAHCGGELWNMLCVNHETGGLEPHVICIDCHRAASEDAARKWKAWYGKHYKLVWAPFEDQADAHDALDTLISAAHGVQRGLEADDNIYGYPNMSQEQRHAVVELLETMNSLKPLLEGFKGHYMKGDEK